MKKFILTIVTIAFFIYPSICLSSYLIELKNGSTFITNHYWEEGRQIKFYCRGGVVGIRKDMVRQIRESDLPYIKEEPQPAREEDAKAETKHKSELKQEKESQLPTHPEKEAFLEEKMRITTEIKTVRAAFRKAKAKNDAEQMQVEAKRLRFLKTELSRFRNKVKTSYGGVMPAWWDSQM